MRRDLGAFAACDPYHATAALESGPAGCVVLAHARRIKYRVLGTKPQTMHLVRVLVDGETRPRNVAPERLS